MREAISHAKAGVGACVEGGCRSRQPGTGANQPPVEGRAHAGEGGGGEADEPRGASA